MSTIDVGLGERRAVVDAAPGDADRRHARRPWRRPCRTASRRRRPPRSGVSPSRSSASRSGSGAGLLRGASSPPTTTSNRCPISVAANASSTVERRFAETSPSRRPSRAEPQQHVVHPEADLRARCAAARCARDRRGRARRGARRRRTRASAPRARARRPPPSAPRRESPARARSASHAASRRG